MLTFIFIIGFVILAVFIPQAISGLNWQELIKILQEIDDQWIKEIAQAINVEYTTMTQFATQTILICAGILIAYIVVATIIVKLIKKLSNSNQKEKTTYNQTNEFNQKTELTKKEKIKYNLPIIILATTTIITFIILIVFSDKSGIVTTIFGASFWLQVIIIPFLIDRKNRYLKYYRKTNTTNNSKAKKETITNTNKKIDDVDKNKECRKEKNTNENTKLNEQADKPQIIRPQVNIEKIRELQKQLKEQNKGETTNE